MAVQPIQVPLLFFYAASNALFRTAGLQVGGDFVLKFRFGRFNVSPHCGDLGTIGEIFVQRPYEVSAAFIPREGDICIDVGANIGCVSLLWRLTNKNGRIIAIEPHPVTFRRMLDNFSLNQIAAIESVEAAIGSHDGQIEILIDNDNNSMAKVVSASEVMPAFKDQRTTQVPCLTLDGLLADRGITRVDLLKIDVEGAEELCLEGARKTLKMSDKIILEYHSPQLRDSCARILTAHGFEHQIVGTLLFAKKPEGPDIRFGSIS
jgi:FkbM family methyltransferase